MVHRRQQTSSRGGGDPVRRGSRFDHCGLWNTESPAGACYRAAIRPTRWRVTTMEYEAAFSRRFAPEVCISFCPHRHEGAGKTGCLPHPRSRVQVHKEVRTRAYRFGWSIPAFPAQWLYGLLRAHPGERLFCHRRLRDLSQTYRQHRGGRTTRLHRTLKARTSIAPLVSIASHRASVTMANAPHPQ